MAQRLGGGDPTLTDTAIEASPVMQQIGLLNLRINDMMTQLNAVMKTMMDENGALRLENADLKARQEKAIKS
jgi:regulator of replication initiation timing